MAIAKLQPDFSRSSPDLSIHQFWALQANIIIMICIDGNRQGSTNVSCSWSEDYNVHFLKLTHFVHELDDGDSLWSSRIPLSRLLVDSLGVIPPASAKHTEESLDRCTTLVAAGSSLSSPAAFGVEVRGLATSLEDLFPLLGRRLSKPDDCVVKSILPRQDSFTSCELVNCIRRAVFPVSEGP